MLQAVDDDFELPEESPEEARWLRLVSFGESLKKKRQEAIDARVASGVERRWIEDQDAYHGRDGNRASTNVVDTASQMNRVKTPRETNEPPRSRVFVQLTRQKTNAGAARLADMLFPTDDRNWVLRATPVPDLMTALTDARNVGYVDPEINQQLKHPDEERDLTLADLAAEQIEDAKRRCAAMQKLIDDQLIECQFNFQGRQVIADAAKLGSGVLKGPWVVNRTRKAWKKSKTSDGQWAYIMQIAREEKPASFRVDPWNFYPDPGCGETIHTGEYVWEVEYLSGRALRQMAQVEGYNRSAMLKVLTEGPRHYASHGAFRPYEYGEGQYANATQFEDKRFQVWTYCGAVTRQELIDCGVVVPKNLNELSQLSAMVTMVNDQIVRVDLNPMDTGDIPYDVYIWEKVDLSPWGVGVPYLMRYAQRTINTAWRALMDNSAVAYGPQIAMKRNVAPADGQWTVEGRKIWWVPNDEMDVQKSFYVFSVPSYQKELMAIIEMAMKFADDETSLPQIAQGERGSAPDTVGGMTLLMNAANAVLKRLVKQYDDMVTRPHIRRYYDFNMQYAEDEKVKGDFEVDARGSTAMLIRDQQKQSLMNLANLARTPEFGPLIDKEKLFAKMLEADQFTPSDVMASEAEIAAAKEAAKKAASIPPLPIQIAQVKANAEIEKVKIDTASEATNEKLRQENAARDRQHDIELAQLKKELLILQISAEQNLSIQQIKADLAKVVITANAKNAQAVKQPKEPEFA